MSASVIAVVGATATGKSDLALDLADAIGAEIVNADAMQLYRGMDIGTAKVPVDQRRGIPHHQIDVLRVDQEASVAAYQHHGREDLNRIASRGRTAIVVGGSGLYVRALLDRMSFPGTDPALRTELEERAVREGASSLHRELARLDPEAAQRIDPRNQRRVIRALEVIHLTGSPFSANLPDYRYEVPAVQIGLAMPAAQLDARIETRARQMFDGGLVEETERLLEEGLEWGRTANRAVGYVQALAVLRGRMNKAEAIAETALATRQLARRQRKWFRRDPRVHWIDAGEDAFDQAIAHIRRSAAD